MIQRGETLESKGHTQDRPEQTNRRVERRPAAAHPKTLLNNLSRIFHASNLSYLCSPISDNELLIPGSTGDETRASGILL